MLSVQCYKQQPQSIAKSPHWELLYFRPGRDWECQGQVLGSGGRPQGELYHQHQDWRDQTSWCFRVREDTQHCPVQGFELGSPSLSSDMTVVIYLVGKNNNLPVFSRLQYSITIPEDTPSLTLVLQVAATDGDPDRRARLHYSVEPGLSTARTEQGHLPLSDWAGMFSVHQPLGRLWLVLTLIVRQWSSWSSKWWWRI